MKRVELHPLSLLAGLLVGGVLLVLVGMQQVTNTRLIITGEQQEILSHMSIVYLDDGQGGRNKTIRISDINVQIVNGLDATNGYPRDPSSIDPLFTQTNGLGNLIVGYNEMGNPYGDDRTGSHNIVVGHGNTFASFGGFVACEDNTISGVYSSVSAGKYNNASGDFSSVSGGDSNSAKDNYSSVSGGGGNTANNYYSSVSGGRFNIASGSHSSVSGGFLRTASGLDDWAAGSLWEDQ